MSGRNRQFHGVRHAWDLAQSDNALLVLAALYHDIVQYRVDHQFPPFVRRIVERYIHIDNDNFYFSGKTKKEKIIYTTVCAIFGHDPTKTISIEKGINELLSSLFCVDQLWDIVDKKNILIILSLIESTIPIFFIKNAQQWHITKKNNIKKASDIVLSKPLSNKEIDEIFISWGYYCQ